MSPLRDGTAACPSRLRPPFSGKDSAFCGNHTPRKRGFPRDGAAEGPDGAQAPADGTSDPGPLRIERRPSAATGGMPRRPGGKIFRCKGLHAPRKSLTFVTDYGYPVSYELQPRHPLGAVFPAARLLVGFSVCGGYGYYYCLIRVTVFRLPYFFALRRLIL